MTQTDKEREAFERIDGEFCAAYNEAIRQYEFQPQSPIEDMHGAFSDLLRLARAQQPQGSEVVERVAVIICEAAGYDAYDGRGGDSGRCNWEGFVSDAEKALSAVQQPALSPLNTFAPEKEDKACQWCYHVTKAGEHHAHPCSADSGHPDDAHHPTPPALTEEEVFPPAPENTVSSLAESIGNLAQCILGEVENIRTLTSHLTPPALTELFEATEELWRRAKYEGQIDDADLLNRVHAALTAAMAKKAGV